MDTPIRWGILGCGRIARKFAADLQFVSDAKLVAAGSRNKDAANEFSKEFPVQHLHYDYQSLVQNPQVDVIYVASPHALHFEHTLLCLNNNKAVLCEKAFAINLKQAKQMVSLAREKKLFLMEALWTKFMPHYQTAMHYVHQGKLGILQNMQVSFGFRPQHPIPVRLFDPSLGGGSLLDIGVYNVFMALSAMGRPDAVESTMSAASTGVDEQCAILFKYNNGRLAQLLCSFTTNLATEADIAGTAGRIRLTHRFYEPSTSIEYYPERNDSRQIIDFHKEQGWGYQYEARHVNECLRKGLTESPVMSHTDSLLLMETLDRVRQAAGLRYPADE